MIVWGSRRVITLLSPFASFALIAQYPVTVVLPLCKFYTKGRRIRQKTGYRTPRQQ